MFARVVRFTDVSPDQMDAIRTRITEGDGPPEGVPSSSIAMYYDKGQSTAIAVASFKTEDDMKKGGEVLDAMDSSETPGSRASVDMCELAVEMDA